MGDLQLNHKSTILTLRWLTVLLVVLLMVYSRKGLTFGTGAYLLGVTFLLSNIILSFIPRERFRKPVVSSAVVLMDVGFVSLAIYLTSGFNTDFYLVYFLVIFIAAMRQELKGSVMAGVIAIILYGWLASRTSPNFQILSTSFLIRANFFLLISTFSGFLAQRAKTYEEERRNVQSRTKELETRLEESEERYRTTFESANDVIMVLNNRGKILDVNEKLSKIAGYKREEFVGKNIRALSGIISKRSLPIIMKNFVKRMAGVETPPYEVEVLTKTKELLNVEISAVALKKDGKTTGDLVILRNITDRKRAAMENANLEARLSAVYQFSKQISTLLNLEDVLNLTLNTVEKVLGYKYCAIHFVDHETNQLYNKLYRGYSRKLMENFRLQLDGPKGITAWVAREGKSIIVPNVGEDPRYVKGIERAKSEMAAPLKVGDEVIGVMNVESPQLNGFSDKDLTVLTALASYVAIAVKNSLLFTDLVQAKEKLERWNVKLEEEVE